MTHVLNTIQNYSANGSTYCYIHVKVLGNVYSILECSGKSNYVNVTKKTNNPYGTSGKQYANFDIAISSYKSPEMKTQLILAASAIIDFRVKSELERFAVNN